ncbi:MAG: hypothetical protein QOJ29_2724 [Thermoleophilaceae bacterium]|jgi:hypothetical protein|nr:hypothetical protein [Thermoleophilaceae bacterium]
MRGALVGVALFALAGCGGSGDKPAGTQPTGTTTAERATPKEPEPRGRLTAPEFEAYKTYYGLVAKVAKEKKAGRAVPLAKRACRSIARGPQTMLVRTSASECVQATRVLRASAAFVTQAGECRRAATAGDVSCFANLLRNMAGSGRAEAVRAAELRHAVERRRLRGRCARVLGASPSQLNRLKALSRHARGAALALEAKDDPRYQRALKAVADDLNAIADEESANDVASITRFCAHD